MSETRWLNWCKPALRAMAVLWMGLIPAGGRADFTAIGSDKDGSLNATATITPGDDTITVTLTNNVSGQISVGQSIADVYFQVSDPITGKASISSFSGSEVTPSSPPTLPTSVSTSNWNIDSNASAILLGTIAWSNNGLSVQKGSSKGMPTELIANSIETHWDGSLTSHAPDLVGTVTFTLNAPGVTSTTTISNVIIAFGTQPEATLTATNPVPAPSAFILQSIGGICLLGYWVLLRRRRLAA